MMRAPSSVLLAFALAACGGSEPPPESPASAASEPAADTPSTAPAAAAGPAGKGDDGWEGEKEATATGAAAGDKGGSPAPSDAKKEETRTAEVIAKVVKDNRQAVRDCYDKALKDLPTLKGDLVITFTLDPEGKVKKAELNQQASTLKSPAVADCAIKVIKGLTFPPSSRGMETISNYPFNFNPK
jgi:hypothetical protein